jgi:hypothetical protein
VRAKYVNNEYPLIFNAVMSVLCIQCSEIRARSKLFCCKYVSNNNNFCVVEIPCAFKHKNFKLEVECKLYLCFLDDQNRRKG